MGALWKKQYFQWVKADLKSSPASWITLKHCLSLEECVQSFKIMKKSMKNTNYTQCICSWMCVCVHVREFRSEFFPGLEKLFFSLFFLVVVSFDSYSYAISFLWCVIYFELFVFFILFSFTMVRNVIRNHEDICDREPYIFFFQTHHHNEAEIKYRIKRVIWNFSKTCCSFSFTLWVPHPSMRSSHPSMMLLFFSIVMILRPCTAARLV